MLLIEIILLALALAMDSATVSLAATASGRSTGNRATFRLAFPPRYRTITQPAHSIAGYFSAILSESPIRFSTILPAGFGWSRFSFL